MPPSAVTGAVCYSHSIAAAAESYTVRRAKFPAVFCRSDAVRVRLAVDGQHQHGAVVCAARPLNGPDFSAMPGIVGEGRRVINNIQRAATLFLVKNIFSLGLSLLSLFTNWPYPLVPVHLSVISSLTIGVPSFFLAMEPNYERVTGRFLPGVLRRAFPGGLTNIFVVLMAQAYGAVFGLPQEQLSAVCAAILSIVGLLVLYQVCKPFDFFRRIIWFAMGVCRGICR